MLGEAQSTKIMLFVGWQVLAVNYSDSHRTRYLYFLLSSQDQVKYRCQVLPSQHAQISRFRRRC